MSGARSKPQRLSAAPPKRRSAPAVGPSALAPPPDRRAMAKAVAEFLRAAGVAQQQELVRTPERVAQVWADDFLDGYQRDPARALGALFSAPDSGLVCVTGLDFHSTCPHHLLPYRGVAHLAYLPAVGRDAKVVGFSRLANLVDALAHRLVLQESLALAIAEALQAGASARGAGCVLAAEQACLSCRAETKANARTVCSAFTGALSTDAALADRLYQAIASGYTVPAEVAP